MSTADETLPVAGDTSIRVALLLPLTGAHGRLGQDLLDAAQLALFDLALDNFVLMPRDTGGTPEGSLAAAQSALEAGASLILGPLLATSVEAVAPEARAAGVNVVAYSTDRTVAGDGIFIMGFLARAQIERVVTFARSKGLVRFAAIVPTTPYGVAVVDGLRDSAARNYGAVTQVEFYDTADSLNHVVRRLAQYETRRAALVSQRLELQEKDDEIARQALLRLEGLETIGELEFEAILLPEGGDRLLAIAPLLPYYDIDPAKVKLLGTGQWDDPAIGVEPALIGGWFAAPLPEARVGFERRYEEVYRRKPVRLATLAYDGTALAAVLGAAERGLKFDVATLTAKNGFAGLDGIFRFHENGVVERGLAVLEVRRHGFHVMSPAPETFLSPPE